jgi:NAD(P)H-flavin reductase
MSAERSAYMPSMAVIENIVDLTDEDRLFTIEVSDATLRSCLPGQFVQVWVPGVGECPISVCCGQVGDTIQLCVRRAGRVTSALFQKQVGEEIGLRGPCGHGFPVNDLRGKNVVMVAGGLGIAPIRSVWQYLLSHRNQFGRVILVYGARKLTDLLFADELEDLSERGDIELDIAAEESEAENFCELPIFKGVITKPIRAISLDSSFAAVVCGPPGMYKYVVAELEQKGVSPSQIFLSLERHMKCGIGKCGHCFVGGLFTCKAGPVFTCEGLTGCPEAIECA